LWDNPSAAIFLIEEDHLRTALDILRGAEADPLSPSAMVGTAADEATALRQRLLAWLPDGESRPAPPRVEVAEQARQALLEVADAG
jgi:hypothetical protein